MRYLKCALKVHLISFLLLVLFLLAPALNAAPGNVQFVVNSTADAIDADTADGLCLTAGGSCTLRAAVMQSNTITGPGVDITVPAGVYFLTRPPAGNNGADSGDLNFATPTGMPVTTVFGALNGETIIDGSQLDRVIRVHPQRHVILSSLTIRKGFLDPAIGDVGAGIRNEGILTLQLSRVRDNVAFDGAGIANLGTLDINHSTISDNFAYSTGAGLYNDPACTKSAATHTNSATISDNSARYGAGIRSCGPLFMINSTVSSNRADVDGGGIYNQGVANVYNTTIALNQADADANQDGAAGGIYSALMSAVFNLRNSLVAANFKGNQGPFDECLGQITSYGHNLIGIYGYDPGCVPAIAYGDWGPLNAAGALGPLQDNGGPTWTHALLPGSNAIDGADPLGGCVDEHSQPLAFDQRNRQRVVDGDEDGTAWCDVGAFEYEPQPAAAAGLLYLPAVIR